MTDEFKIKKIVIVGANAFLTAAKSLMQRGELTAEQYAGMVKRARAMPEKAKLNTVILKEG